MHSYSKDGIIVTSMLDTRTKPDLPKVEYPVPTPPNGKPRLSETLIQALESFAFTGTADCACKEIVIKVNPAIAKYFKIAGKCICLFPSWANDFFIFFIIY